MKARERSVQQLYPLGAAASRPLSLLAAFIAPLLALVMAAQNREEINSPLLALGSLVLIVAASVTVIVGSSPLRAPFTNQSATFTLLWANAAMILGAASMWQTDTQLRNDWGTTIVGVMIIAIAPYRPSRELVVGGVLSSLLAGFIVVLEVGSLDPLVPPIVNVIIAVTPILVLTIGAARFTRAIIRSIESWRRRARVVDSEMDDSDEGTIARSVQQDRVTILNRDIVPFFAALLAQDRLTVSDTERALDIAASVRGIMVAEADRSWLHLVVEQAVGALPPESRAAVPIFDADKLAPRMSFDQRSALRALIGALFAHPDFSSSGFRLALKKRGNDVVVTLRARLDCSEAQVRSEFSPFFAVMRILFTNLGYEFEQSTLTLQFSYDE